MENELREIAELTGQLLGMLEGFWSECRTGALNNAKRAAEEGKSLEL